MLPTAPPLPSYLPISLSAVFPWKNKFRWPLNHGSEPLSWTLDNNPLWPQCGEEDFTAFGTATRVNIRWIRVVCARMHHSPQPMHSRRQSIPTADYLHVAHHGLSVVRLRQRRCIGTGTKVLGLSVPSPLGLFRLEFTFFYFFILSVPLFGSSS